MMTERNFPFAAIVGQEQMRLALLLNAIDPRVGGVLIRGEKGTAKSTIARSLAELLPEQRVVLGCVYNCNPDDPAEQDAEHRDAGSPLERGSRPVRVVELPINATEDRLAGTLDVQAALARGEYRFQPGLLAAANRGILYVDEVNLLPDHLVDLILDAAAMGRNTVEREGISLSHPARFILIGTMNPEEGDLRPQLLDRFGLCVDVTGLAEIDARVEVMRRREAFETEPAAFAAAWAGEQAALCARVVHARDLRPAVQTSDATMRMIAGLSLELGVDGHRADLVILRAAAALAALEGHTEVTEEDVCRAAELALPHRLRRHPFTPQRPEEERLRETLDRLQGSPEQEGAEPERSQSEDGERAQQPPPPPPPSSPGPLALPTLDLARDRTPRTGAGRRQQTTAADECGRVMRTTRPDLPTNDIAVGATLRAAATGPRESANGEVAALQIRPEDLRANVRARKVGASIIFIVDASGSMGARHRLEASRGAMMTLLAEAYQRRDRVALIAFRGDAAQTLLPLTDSVELAQQRLAELPAGGRTPLAAGIHAGVELVRQARLKDARAICIPVLITDGKANSSEGRGSPMDDALEAAALLQQPGVHPLVLDTESGPVSFGLAARLAEHAGARYIRLPDLSAETVAASVQSLAVDLL